MFKPITDSLRRMGGSPYSSVNRLARGLIESAPKLEWPQERSLAAKIGDIDLGRPVWWKSRPEHALALAELLQLPVVDLGLHSDTAGSVHAFTRFPELPPLNLREERFCEIAAPRQIGTDSLGKPYGEGWDDLALWFDPHAPGAQRPAREVHWLHVLPGTGLNLLWEWLEARKHTECLRVETLAQCGQRLRSSRPLALRIEQQDLRDIQALALRNPDLAILVVAPFPAPQRPQAEGGIAFATWEYFDTDGLGRKELLLTDPDETGHGILRFEWQLHTDWQDRLLNWAADRMAGTTKETLLTAAGVSKWMRRFGEELNAIRPADLMAICHLCHSTNESLMPHAEIPDAGARMLRHLTKSKPQQANQFSRLARACLMDRRLPWGDALSADTWLQCLGAAAGTLPDLTGLQAIADAPTKVARRQLAGEMRARIENQSLAGLQANGLLVESAGNHFSLEPSFIADLVARDHILELLHADTVDAWAGLCFDPRRRRLVDAALRVSSVDRLHRLQDQMLDMAADNPLAIAAAEALFFAIGNQAAQGIAIPHGLHAIVERVLPALYRDEFSGPMFWTRPSDTREDAADQLTVLWTWSLMAAPPRWQIPAHWAWHFPGWARDFSESFGVEPLFTVAEPYKAPVHERLLDVAAKVADAVTNPETEPKILVPLLLARALREGSQAHQQWLDTVVREPDLADGFLRQVGDSGSAAALLPLYLDAASQADKDAGAWVYKYSPIRRWLLSTVSPSQADGALNEQQRNMLWSQCRMLPPHLRSWILERAEPRKHDDFVRVAIAYAGMADLQVLEKWLDDDWIGQHAATRMWAIAPQASAKLMASIASGDRIGAKAQLVMACTPDHLSSAIDVLRQEPKLLEQALVQRWAQDRIGQAGTLAEVVLALGVRALADSSPPALVSDQREAPFCGSARPAPALSA